MKIDDNAHNADHLQIQLDRLNPPQRRAVEITEGPVLILAGAGTGKTTVLTTKLAYLVLHKHCPLGHILAVTFTNKAAAEMAERIAKLLGNAGLRSPWVGTFHRICVTMIRQNHALLGLPERFSIMDSGDQLRLLKQIMKAHQLDEKEYRPRLFLWAIGRLKDRALEPTQVTDAELERLSFSGAAAQKLKMIYGAYQKTLLECGSADFGDLILLCLKLFREHRDVLTHYQNKFRYVLVDEYQDINVAQYLWLRLLAADNPNICCVGDDDQSIYGWRGAEIDHILRFERDFSGTTLIKLEDNYRSTESILRTASHFIDHNKGRLGKTLRASCGLLGDAVWVKATIDDRSEARFIGHEVHGTLNNGIDPSEVAILVRASFQTREIEDVLIALGIPYRLVGGTKFYDRLEIKDAVSYLTFLVQPKDNMAFERALGTPKRGIGGATLQKLSLYAREHGVSLWEAALDTVASNEIGLSKGALSKLSSFAKQAQEWQKHLNDPPSTLAEHVLETSGYLDMWRHMRGEDAQERIDNLMELFKMLQDFPSVEEFLDHTSLMTDITPKDTVKGVSVMTLHSAKGLEFHTVFLAGWEENLFPHPRAIDESGARGLEEERRLAYVGLTRAKRKAIITFAHSRRAFGRGGGIFSQSNAPSRFLDELPKEHVRRDTLRRPSYGTSRTSIFPELLTAEEQESVNHSPFSSSQRAQASLVETSAQILPAGTKVSHKTFGNGTIVRNEGLAMEVYFEGVGSRKIMARFLTKI